MYVLDTNTVIYFFKGMGTVAKQLLDTPPSDVAIPTIVVFELLVGIEKSRAAGRRRKQLTSFLQPINLLPFCPESARAAARIRAKLEAKGTPIGPLDTLIAGTAVANGATLVTHNTAEFGRVEGLALTDWY